jgi:ankyrin repeat protein
MVKILLEANVDINATTRIRGETAFDIAIKHGQDEIIRLLLARGSDTKLQTIEPAKHFYTTRHRRSAPSPLWSLCWSLG